MPNSKSNVPPRPSGQPKPFGSTTSSGPYPPSCPWPPDSAASRPRRRHLPMPCAVRCRPLSSCLARALSSFLVLVPVILAAAVLTSPQAPDLEELADVLRRAMAAPSHVPVPETRTRAPGLSFAIPDLIPKPRAAIALRAPGATPQPPSPVASPTDAALASLLEWIPEIPKGCEDEVAHAFHLQLFRQYRANVSTLPQSPIRDQWAWVRSHAPALPGIADVLRTFLASPPLVQQVDDSPAASPVEAAAANQAQGAAKKKGYTPQKV